MGKDYSPKASLGLALLLALACFAPASHAQSLSSDDRDSAHTMLNVVRDDIKKNYYDPSLRGINLDERFKQADERIKAAQSRDRLIFAVAQVMLDFNDSHTYFMPPSRAARVEYGWKMQMFGDQCLVTAVKPKSDAEAKDLKPGDTILSVDGYRPTRDNLWKMYYRYYALAPSRTVRFVVQSPGDAQPREVEVQSKIEMGQAVALWENIFVRYIREEWDIYHDRFYEAGDALIWKMPTFEVAEDHIDGIMSKARKFKTLVLDLRDNGGGSTDALTRLAGYFFDHDVKVADLKGRKEMEPITAKTRGGNTFKGQLIVVVDSNTGSASEIFARLVQLEKRGAVVGDHTAGAVMVARHYDHETGVGRVLYFGASVTIADLVMSDGKSLENVGVTPDEVVTPTGADLAANRDPVLTRAAALAGVQLDSEKAGSLFPVDWKR